MSMHNPGNGQMGRFIRDTWRAEGKREPHMCVWRDGQDVTDTAHPDQWPEPDRWFFYTLGWRSLSGRSRPARADGTAPRRHRLGIGRLAQR